MNAENTIEWTPEQIAELFDVARMALSLARMNEAAAPEPAPVVFAKSSRVLCRRCGGLGKIPGMEHIARGVCFRCGGTGTD